VEWDVFLRIEKAKKMFTVRSFLIKIALLGGGGYMKVPGAQPTKHLENWACSSVVRAVGLKIVFLSLTLGYESLRGNYGKVVHIFVVLP
jgi:hypothetical protein